MMTQQSENERQYIYVGVGVMKDYKLKLRNLRVSHTQTTSSCTFVCPIVCLLSIAPALVVLLSRYFLGVVNFVQYARRRSTSVGSKFLENTTIQVGRTKIYIVGPLPSGGPRARERRAQGVRRAAESYF